MLGEMDLDSSRDKDDHTLAISAATIFPIYQSSSKSNSKNSNEVYMVSQGDPPLLRPPKKSNERYK
jgi:hypothetical protein